MGSIRKRKYLSIQHLNLPLKLVYLYKYLYLVLITCYNMYKKEIYMRYSIGRFRKDMKEAFIKADNNEEVSISRMGTLYYLTKGDKLIDSKKNPIIIPEKITYRCGCKKEDGRPLCKNHGRN
jgi:hypothetical protein